MVFRIWDWRKTYTDKKFIFKVKGFFGRRMDNLRAFNLQQNKNFKIKQEF